MKNKLLLLFCLIYAATALAGGLLASEPALAAPPSISAAIFPDQFEVSATGSGEILFNDPDHDVLLARLDVADGRYYRRIAAAADASLMRQGRLPFNLECTNYGQKVTLAITLFDSKGERSRQQQLSFICGQPAVYNFDAEQSEILPVTERVPLNFFILDDGVTSLAEDAQFTGQSPLGTPSSAVVSAIRETVSPRLTGIWDQCGLGFDAVNVWVVRPADLQISGVSLEQRLFGSRNGQRVILYGRESADALRQATLQWWRAAQQQSPRAAAAFNVLFVGASILVEQNGAHVESEGFSESVWPNYAIVRWGASLNTVLPKQMISTLAHELGHNLGLAHPGEDDLRETLQDGMNLMLGSGVSPQPRANLIGSQCARATAAYAALKARLASQQPENQSPGASSGGAAPAAVSWKQSCPKLVCTGKVELLIEATGFADLESFGFASFEYSADGERFVEIGVDRRHQDGFSMAWDTTKLANGTYTLRVVVTDAKGIRASATLKVTVQNGT